MVLRLQLLPLTSSMRIKYLHNTLWQDNKRKNEKKKGINTNRLRDFVKAKRKSKRTLRSRPIYSLTLKKKGYRFSLVFSFFPPSLAGSEFHRISVFFLLIYVFVLCLAVFPNNVFECVLLRRKQKEINRTTTTV